MDSFSSNEVISGAFICLATEIQDQIQWRNVQMQRYCAFLNLRKFWNQVKEKDQIYTSD